MNVFATTHGYAFAKRTARGTLASVAILFLLSLTYSRPVAAEEPAREFLEELRKRGYYQTALDYLAQMESSSLASPAFKRIIPFEQGTTLIDMASTIRDNNVKKELLDEAQTYIDQFTTQQPNHELVAIAQNRLANLLIQRAEVNVINSRQNGISDARREELLADARQQYEDAAVIFQQTRVELNEKLKAISPDNQDSRFVRLRDQYRAEYLQALLLLPAVKEQRADTYDESNPLRAELLEEAITDYASLAERYRNWDAALYAQVYQARSLTKLSRYEEALEVLRDILAQDNSPDFRHFKKMALLLAVQAWEQVESEEPLAFEAIAKLEPVIATVAENETDSDWLTLKLALARAYFAAADALEAREERTADDRRQITTYQNLATSMAREVAGVTGPFKIEAQTLLVERGVTRSVANEEIPEPTTFAEAKKRARTLLDEFEAARFAVSSLSEQVSSTSDPQLRAALRSQLQDAEQSVATLPDESLRYFQMAIDFALADEETEEDDVSSTRYFMAYIYFVLGNYEHVGVIGEYLIRNSPQGAGARETCDLSLSAYWQMYSEADANDRQFERDLLKTLGDQIVVQWNGQEEAVKAATLLGWIMLEEGDIAAAESYLAAIPESSPRRYESELAMGQALWKRYLAISRMLSDWEENGVPEGESVQARTDESSELLTKAVIYLESGAKQLAVDTVEQSTAIASLSLAQAYIEVEQIDKAIQHLEGPAGMLALLGQNHPAVADPWIVVNSYKTAVRAYIGGIESTSNKTAMINKALGIMNRLKAAIGDDAAGRRQLVQIYLSLATDLKNQMDLLPSIQQKESFAEGLVAFLDAIRTDAEEMNTLVWVAQTLNGLGESFASAGLDDKSSQFFSSAEQSYLAILQKGNEEEGWLPDDVEMEVVRRLARCRVAKDDYEGALVAFAVVLSERPTLLDVQIEAAEAIQGWAAQSSSSARYELAWRGMEPRENPETGRTSNAIWGWGKISQASVRNPNFRQQFFHSRLQLARCRLEYAKLEDSDRYREQARKEIYQTYALFPELGGPEMRTNFDRLLREVQREMGENSPQGLQAFESEDG